MSYYAMNTPGETDGRLGDLLVTLECMPGPAATRREWEIRCGATFPLIEPMLAPAGGVAEYVPCMSPLLGLHHHEVVEMDDGQEIAVFADEDYDCPTFPVERHERAVLRPDMARLAAQVCSVLGLEHGARVRPESIAIDEYPLLEIGRFHPLEGCEFPVVLSCHGSLTRTEEALLLCVAVFDGPFIFLTATKKPAFKRAGPIISARSILVSSLAECLDLSDNGVLSATSRWQRSLAQFARRVVPKPEQVLAFFETPANTPWERVRIRFIDSHIVTVDAAGTRGRFSYTEMGMANRRESKPSKQWEFLERIAENHGSIDFDMGDPKKNKSWKYELTRDLRRFFRIEDDPFLYDMNSGCWQARFGVHPVSDV